MKTLTHKIKRFLKQIRGRFNSPLPVGVTEFKAWCDDIRATYDLPTESEEDILFCFSAVIMRFDEISDKKPKYHFVRAFRSGAAKQVASHTFTETKLKQQAAMKAAQEAAKAAQEALPNEAISS